MSGGVRDRLEMAVVEGSDSSIKGQGGAAELRQQLLLLILQNCSGSFNLI